MSMKAPLLVLAMVILLPLLLFIALLTNSYYQEYLAVIELEASVIDVNASKCPSRQCEYKYKLLVSGESEPRVVVAKEELQKSSVIRVLVKPDLNNNFIRIGSKSKGFLFYYWTYLGSYAIKFLLIFVVFLLSVFVSAKYNLSRL
ncbi:TPA: hypothetical protein NJZ52_004393 [Vibrio parahaemolyticus]|nr:hypothetical protein [Vibrio parahaemolyticus]